MQVPVKAFQSTPIREGGKQKQEKLKKEGKGLQESCMLVLTPAAGFSSTLGSSPDTTLRKSLVSHMGCQSAASPHCLRSGHQHASGDQGNVPSGFPATSLAVLGICHAAFTVIFPQCKSHVITLPEAHLNFTLPWNNESQDAHHGFHNPLESGPSMPNCLSNLGLQRSPHYLSPLGPLLHTLMLDCRELFHFYTGPRFLVQFCLHISWSLCPGWFYLTCLSLRSQFTYIPTSNQLSQVQ